jgi:hypothetical protein
MQQADGGAAAGAAYRKRGAWIHNKKMRNVNRLTAEQNLAALLVRNMMRRNLGF